jgi:hypothetical protein
MNTLAVIRLGVERLPLVMESGKQIRKIGSDRSRHKVESGQRVEEFGKKLVKGGTFIDVKAAFDAAATQAVGDKLWRL